MDVTQLPRNPEKIHSVYTELPDGSLVANRPFLVYLPKRFTENDMAEVTDVVRTAAVLGIVIPGECYAPLTALMDITLCPSAIHETTIDGTRYLVLEFDEGDTFIENLNVPKEPNQPYFYYMEFVIYAKIPWYVDKDTLTSLFDYASQDLGKKVGETPQIMRVLMSMMFRDPDNLDRAYRNSQAMLDGRPPVIVGLNNSSMLIDGTFSKLLGGYLADNMLSAIINQDDKVTDLDKMIKGMPNE